SRPFHSNLKSRQSLPYFLETYDFKTTTSVLFQNIFKNRPVEIGQVILAQIAFDEMHPGVDKGLTANALFNNSYGIVAIHGCRTYPKSVRGHHEAPVFNMPIIVHAASDMKTLFG